MNEQSVFQTQATVSSLQQLSAGYYRLVVHAPEIAAAASPGQFAQLRVAKDAAIDPLLARPISIHDATPETGVVSFIFKVVGRGTEMLTKVVAGETMTILGPVGRGFAVPASASSIALMAGGVGMPPMYFLAKQLRRMRPDLAITLFYGGRSIDDLLELSQWDALGVTVVTATDDGSHGHHGLVTEPLLQALRQRPFDYIAACGPRPMLRAVQKIALAEHIPGELSLEARMACGIGACLGCTCATLSGNRRVCVDGPVFPFSEVSFDV